MGLPDQSRHGQVLEELHGKRHSDVHTAPVCDGSNPPGCCASVHIPLLLLGVHARHWLDEAKLRAGHPQGQHARNIGIFNCEQSDVFADVDVEVGPGLRTIQVSDVEGDFHLAKRKTSGTWVNTGMFTQIWKKITKHAYTDWVAKVDADAVFIPNRLRSWLGEQLVPTNGIYLENCKYVDYGYFGNLEVFSKAAFTTLLANIDLCKASPEINWKVGIKNGKYGPMGEDLFAQTCLDLKGVRRVEAFDITTDGA